MIWEGISSTISWGSLENGDGGWAEIGRLGGNLGRLGGHIGRLGRHIGSTLVKQPLDFGPRSVPNFVRE